VDHFPFPCLFRQPLALRVQKNPKPNKTRQNPKKPTRVGLLLKKMGFSEPWLPEVIWILNNNIQQQQDGGLAKVCTL